MLKICCFQLSHRSGNSPSLLSLIPRHNHVIESHGASLKGNTKFSFVVYLPVFRAVAYHGELPYIALLGFKHKIYIGIIHRDTIRSLHSYRNTSGSLLLPFVLPNDTSAYFVLLLHSSPIACMCCSALLWCLKKYHRLVFQLVMDTLVFEILI